ncbi:MAG: ABC transporter permease [Oscillospiraceae bacterium]|jgi:simple sugar transport system permease protein|nr:ABC transporter permease [Oscillospiraceae bacterium]
MDTVIIDGLSFMMPLLCIAVGGIYSERSGVTNLALEGLLGAGAFVGALFVAFFGKLFPETSSAPMYFAMAASVVGGAVYAMLHGLLCVKFRANQVISGVVINILAVALTTFLTREINSGVFQAPSDKIQLGVSPRFDVPGLSKIPVLGAVFKSVYPFQVVILVVIIIAWYALYRTRFGMRLRACGDNPHAVDAAGINVQRTRFLAVMISGALSGLGGISFAYSFSANFSASIYVGAGYLAIAALIFGNWKIVPTVGACLLFGLARSGGYKLVQLLALPSSYSDLIMILPYVVTLLLLIFFSGTNRAPRALGEIYDKGKR